MPISAEIWGPCIALLYFGRRIFLSRAEGCELTPSLINSGVFEFSRMLTSMLEKSFHSGITLAKPVISEALAKPLRLETDIT